jgi:FlaA1/EpsC-like NDP-sugar epimerase
MGVSITGIRYGEKIHEVLCSSDESVNLFENKSYYTIYPAYFKKKKGKLSHSKRVRTNMNMESLK